MNKVIYYWNLYKKIGDKKLIKEYQVEIDKIEKLIDIKMNRYKKNVKIIGVIFLIIILVFTILLLVKPIRKDINVKLSKINEEANNYIITPLLNCSYVKKNIKNDKLRLFYSCKNIVQNNKEYIFDYDFSDDEAPYIKSNTCIFEENDTPNYNCIEVVDDVDGKIDDFKVNDSNVDFSTIGNKKVLVEGTDKAGNRFSTEAYVEILKTKLTKIEVNISKDSYRVGDTEKITVSIEPAKLKDKTVRFSSSNPDIASIDNNGTISFKSVGDVKICAISNYDNSKMDCKDIKVNAACLKTYVYNLDESKNNELKVNIHYCPGTYKIYTPVVLNKDEAYHVNLNYGSFNKKIITIWKITPLNEEGYKASLGEDSSISIPVGIKQFKLVKVS